MRYYILRTYGTSDSYFPEENRDYSFKKSNFNAERFLSDAKTEDIYYFLYHIPSNSFVEYGQIQDIKVDSSTKEYHAIYSNRHNIDIRYTPYSSPNCGIIPISKKRIDEIIKNN